MINSEKAHDPFLVLEGQYSTEESAEIVTGPMEINTEE